MSSTGLIVRQLIAWFAGVLPICFYLALAVVCGLHRRWISFTFSVALMLALLVSVVLNCVAIISTILLTRSRVNFAQRVKEIPGETLWDSLYLEGSAPVCANPQIDLFDVDGNETRMINRQSDEAVLSSIRESTTVSLNTVKSQSFSPSVLGSSRASVNPLCPPLHPAAAVRVVPQESVQPRREASVTQLEETFMLSPPSALEHRFMRDRTSAAFTSPPLGPSTPQSYPEERPSADRSLSGSFEHSVCGRKDNAQQFAAQLYEPLRAPTSVRRMPEASAIPSIHDTNSSKFFCTAFMMPFVSLYMTIILTILTLVGSLMFEYDTHCLFLASPALGVPWLWVNLLPVRNAFQNTSENAQNFHGRLVCALTHWLFMTAISIVSLGVFVAAFMLEVVYWPPYRIDGEATPRSICVLSYIAPVLVMAIMGIVFSNLESMHSTSGECAESGPLVAEAVPVTTDYRGCPPAQETTRVLTPGLLPGDCGGEALPFAGLGNLTGTSLTDSAGVVSVAVVCASAQSTVVTPNLAPMSNGEPVSTLSSILRSATGGSAFIPLINKTSITMLPRSKGFRHGIQLSSNGSSDLQKGSHPATTMTSVPQLKTVTMLYVAYRDICDGGDSTMASTFKASHQKGSVAASRNQLQAVSVNFEVMMEALEDAREQGSADANAYVLTAYEDAICLVWGLIPFRSDPVLLAIEKAIQIMEAFKSRPKPPPSFSCEQRELVAAVVSAPYSLVGLIGSGAFRSIHFFNPRQHVLGAQMLRRGTAMYCRLPSVQASLDEPENPFHCILLDGRSWSSTASHVLARPCGICRSYGLGADAKQPNQRSSPLNVTTNPTRQEFLITYNFMEMVQAKEEEWHLVVQRQEHLGAKFNYLSEAVQRLHQGDQSGACKVLRDAMQSAASNSDADNITLAQMLLEDLECAEDGGPHDM
ncbi:hypothetical protein MNV84_06886 [Leishmania braziliensis]|nr:hypothetical protein MNV84_06886 [Leishmania braziliensis]